VLWLVSRVCNKHQLQARALQLENEGGRRLKDRRVHVRDCVQPHALDAQPAGDVVLQRGGVDQQHAARLGARRRRRRRCAARRRQRQPHGPQRAMAAQRVREPLCAHRCLPENNKRGGGCLKISVVVAARANPLTSRFC
jgi:hypothetical protein